MRRAAMKRPGAGGWRWRLEYLMLVAGLVVMLSSYVVLQHHTAQREKLAQKLARRKIEQERANRVVEMPSNICWSQMRIKEHNYSRKSVISEAPGWADLLKKVAGDTGVVVVVTGTDNYASALNSFYHISIAQHGIDNFLFVALSEGMCKTRTSPGLLHPAVPCMQYPFILKDGGMFGTQEFKEVVAVKTDLLLGIVEHNYTALLSDADITFFVDPLPELARMQSEKDAELVIQSDSLVGLNSGFMYLPPTQGSRRFLVDVIFGQEKDVASSQQKIINRLLGCYAKRTVRFTSVMLPDHQWPCGRIFHRLDASPISKASRHFAWDSFCDDCRLYHNNWVVGEHAKRLRFKELLQWADDAGAYYSNRTAKYLMLGNPDGGAKDGKRVLVAGMQVAALLNRILILPWLRCSKPSGPRHNATRPDACTLNEVMWMQNWVDVFPERTWRESMFRYNPLTAKGVRLRHNLGKYTSWAEGDGRVEAPGSLLDPTLPPAGLASMQHPPEPQHFIATASHPTAPPSFPPSPGQLPFPGEAEGGEVVVHVPKTLGQVWDHEVREMLGSAAPVLRLHSLYDTAIKFSNPAEEKQWGRRLEHLSKPQGSAGIEVLNHKPRPPQQRFQFDTAQPPASQTA